MGLLNAMSAGVSVLSNLNIYGFEHHLVLLGNRESTLDFLKYGYATGHVGPASTSIGVSTHPSAANFPRHVDDFIEWSSPS